MNRRSLVTLPLYTLGVTTVLLGVGWLVSPEPWLLDRAANERLLHVGYAELLAADVNQHLGDYLTGFYRFFGWWIICVGALVVSFVFATGMATRRQRHVLHSVLGCIVGGVFVLQVVFIPTSPFVWASLGFAGLILLSWGAARKLPPSAAPHRAAE